MEGKGNSTGFIKIDRGILSWEWYRDINTKVLFLHLLLKANYVEGKFEGSVIPRGCLATSNAHLADETGLSIQNVRTAIKHLKSTGEITVTQHSKYSLIAVNNYALYQDSQHSSQQALNKELTQSQQATNNNIRNKEIKKERIKEIYTDFCNENFLYDFDSLFAALMSFEEMRNKNKKPMTDRARELFLKKLDGMSGDMIAVIEQSVLHGWQDIYELKHDQQKEKRAIETDEVDPMIKSMLARQKREKEGLQNE